MAAAILQLETLARRIASDPTSAAAQLEETTTRTREAMADVRSVLF
jgi:signal transduction histidine kinase